MRGSVTHIQAYVCKYTHSNLRTQIYKYTINLPNILPALPPYISQVRSRYRVQFGYIQLVLDNSAWYYTQRRRGMSSWLQHSMRVKLLKYTSMLQIQWNETLERIYTQRSGPHPRSHAYLRVFRARAVPSFLSHDQAPVPWQFASSTLWLEFLLKVRLDWMEAPAEQLFCDLFHTEASIGVGPYPRMK